jgi:hypothetical protein
MEMISRFKEHKHYTRNIKISFILSELLIICAFLFSPNITHNKIIKFSEPLFIVDDIPVTIQTDKNILEKPRTPEIFMDEEIDEPIILDNAIFANIEQKEVSGSNAIMDANNLNRTGKPGLPRQLLEVLPDKRGKNYSGSLKLKLKIDNFGKVADYVILFNSIDCEDCLKEIISAVYKSLWEPAKKNGIETEFWVEKSYTFN